MPKHEVKIKNTYISWILRDNKAMTYSNFSIIDREGDLAEYLPEKSGLYFLFRKGGVMIQPVGNIDCQINGIGIQSTKVAFMLSDNHPATLSIGGHTFAITLTSDRRAERLLERLENNNGKI